jgi:DNA-binding IclR family transcriptional regulator
MSLGRGAIARSIISFLPRRQRREVIAQNLMELSTVGLGVTVEGVEESLRKVRKAGFAVAYGELTPGVIGIAAPVLDERSLPIASVCASVSGALVTGAQIDEIGAYVRKVAASIRPVTQ